MKKKPIWITSAVLVALALGAALTFPLRRQRLLRDQNNTNYYGVVVHSDADVAKAQQHRDEYQRRAQRLRTEFQPFAQQNQTKIATILGSDAVPELLPRDPKQLLPHWGEISDSLSPDDLSTRGSEALVFSWNAPMTPGDRSVTVHPLRHNFPVAESLLGQNSIVFWLDGTITEESRFGPTKTTLSAKPLKELAPPYDFFQKGH